MAEPGYGRIDFHDLLGAIAAFVPSYNWQVTDGLEDKVIAGDNTSVYTGVNGAVLLANKKIRDLRWIRETFIDHAADFERVNHGRTISPEVAFRANRIGIDTGAYICGLLTALAFEGPARCR